MAAPSGELSLEGVYVDDTARAAVEQAADTSGATSTLTAREAASASDVAALADRLNALVGADPILFEPAEFKELTDRLDGGRA